ncbi:hypothetical protein L6452_39500 [Arctium lappa]|uniref:Uncharacterized protein n=1 Tax=Arctium lappa TaxID=4217 RepID=A0ACB8XU64_ARCLA|nr:hypothetical protein L6452_39500 [Arctium lappa]
MNMSHDDEGGILIIGRESKSSMEQEDRPRRVVVAMKGHPGTGKTTLSRFIATSLRCPLLDKDDVRDSTFAVGAQLVSIAKVESQYATKLLNDLSYEALWRMVKTQLSLGLSVVIDSPLSRKVHLDRLVELTDSFDGYQLVVVECKPKDESEWRRRLEKRGEDGCCGSWHKPTTWRDMEKFLEGYNGCIDYDVGKVPKLVLDTTATSGKVVDLAKLVMEFLDASNICLPFMQTFPCVDPFQLHHLNLAHTSRLPEHRDDASSSSDSRLKC